VKIALLFFLLNSWVWHGCGMPASWAAQHMCLDIVCVLSNLFVPIYIVSLVTSTQFAFDIHLTTDTDNNLKGVSLH